MNADNNHQRGSVSLFVVIFATLLITIVVVSFARIMVRGQLQSTTSDLSQSAYDSAQAGVEDAKRAIIQYQTLCDSNPAGCATAKANLTSPTCNTGLLALSDVTQAQGTNEVKVQNGSTGNSLDQAYTCVKIKLDTDDYIGHLDKNTYKVIPLFGTGSYNAVKIQWFTQADLSSSFNNQINRETSGNRPLRGLDSPWPANRPPIMRAQLIQIGDSFSLDQFDTNNSSGAGGQSNANTLFLYPSNVSDNIRHFALDDVRRTPPTSNPISSHCEPSVASGGYACTSTILIPTPIGGGKARTYLRLGALYNTTTYRITLVDGMGNRTTDFDSVQPEIDSTGRANDLFRRVKSRVELSTYFPYPDAEITTSGSLCKEFLVTDQEADYDDGSCRP